MESRGVEWGWQGLRFCECHAKRGNQGKSPFEVHALKDVVQLVTFPDGRATAHLACGGAVQWAPREAGMSGGVHAFEYAPAKKSAPQAACACRGKLRGKGAHTKDWCDVGRGGTRATVEPREGGGVVVRNACACDAPRVLATGKCGACGRYVYGE